MPIIVWGAGRTFRSRLKPVLDSIPYVTYELVDSYAQSCTGFLEKTVHKPEEIKDIEYDYILVCASDKRFNDEILAKAKLLNIPDDKIVPALFVETLTYPCRIWEYFLRVKDFCAHDGVQIIGCGLFLNGDAYEMVIHITNNMLKSLSVKALVLKKCVFKIFDLMTNEVLLEKDINEFEMAASTVDVITDSSLLKLSFSNYSVPWLNLSVADTNASKVFESLPIEQVKTNFSNVLAYTDARRYHEEDYMIIRNFCDFPGTLLDLGANYGQSAYSFLQASSNFNVVSFEANPDLQPLLSILKSLYPVRYNYYGCAVGSGEGSAGLSFYYSPKFYMISGTFDKSFFLSRQADITENAVKAINIPIKSVDSLLTKAEAERVFFVKMDLEGFEFEALRGMRQLLRENRPILLIEENAKIFERIWGYLYDDYNVYYYDYTKNTLTKENVCQSLNYFMIPKNGTKFQDINSKIRSLFENPE